MDKRYLNKCIKEGAYRPFVVARLTLPRDQPIPLDQLMDTLKALLRDQKIMTPEEAGAIVAMVQHAATGLAVRFGMVASPQADITKSSDMGIDEHRFRELDARLAICVKIAANSILEGQAFVLTAEENMLYASAVRDTLAKAASEKMARAVAKRARGTASLFDLGDKSVELGGKHNIPTKYPDGENLILRGCCIEHWPAKTKAAIKIKKCEEQTWLKPFIKKGKIDIWVPADSESMFALKCADASNVSFDVTLNLVENLSPKRTEPHVIAVNGHDAILGQTRARIDVRLKSPGATNCDGSMVG